MTTVAAPVVTRRVAILGALALLAAKCGGGPDPRSHPGFGSKRIPQQRPRSGVRR
jgi:hypothetical protein